MAHRTVTNLVLAWLLSVSAWPVSAHAQTLSARQLADVDGWYRRTAERTPRGMWGIVIARMDGTVLWSINPDLELIPASTAKVFTTGFARARMGGGARITTRVVGHGSVDSATGRWQGTWALELGGDPDAGPLGARRSQAA